MSMLIRVLLFCLLAGPGLAREKLPYEIRELVSGVEKRSYLLELVGEAEAPRPALIVLHGGGGKPEQIRKHAAFTLADRGWAMIYPKGVDKGWTDGRTGIDGMALRVMHTEIRNELACLLVLDVFGYRFEFHDHCDLGDCGDHRFRYSVVGDVADKPAVYLQDVDSKVLEVRKRTQARAEIIERNAAAVLAQSADELLGFRQVGHGGGFSEFETERGGRQAGRGDLFLYEPEYPVVG